MTTDCIHKMLYNYVYTHTHTHARTHGRAHIHIHNEYFVRSYLQTILNLFSRERKKKEGQRKVEKISLDLFFAVFFFFFYFLLLRYETMEFSVGHSTGRGRRDRGRGSSSSTLLVVPLIEKGSKADADAALSDGKSAWTLGRECIQPWFLLTDFYPFLDRRYHPHVRALLTLRCLSRLKTTIIFSYLELLVVVVVVMVGVDRRTGTFPITISYSLDDLP